MKYSIPALASFLFISLPSQGAEPEPKKPPKPLYTTRNNFDPNGINKFYMGRQIAHVMGYGGAGWLDRKEREKEEEPKRVLAALKLKPGDVVADIGAGSGYYTFRLSQAVGAKGKVYAVDIQKEMLAIIRKRMKARKATNIEPVLTTVKDPKLPANSLDLILMVDVYHEFEFPYEITVELVKALKRGGKLVFVEFRLEDPKVPIKLVHKMTEKQVIREMAVQPLVHAETVKSLPWQHVIIFKKK